MLAGFAEKGGFIERERDPNRIELHHVHQHAAGGFTSADVKGCGPRARSPARQCG
jgi:hypothetical protein